MKNIFIKLLICCFALSATPQLAHAQFGNLKNRIKKRVNDKIENKVDKVVDDVLDSKPNNRNTNKPQSGNPQSESKTASDPNVRTSRSRETGGSTNKESPEERQLRYKNKQIIIDCANFLNTVGNYSFNVMRRGEDYMQLREKMTPEFLTTYFSQEEGNQRHVPALDLCKEYVAREDFESVAMGELDKIYMAFHKKESYTELVGLSEDFAFIGRVILPNNSKIQNLTTYAEKLRDKLGANIDAELTSKTSSTFHKNNIGKVFFTSNRNINPAKATASDFKTNFKAGEDIYGVVYFKEKIYDTYKMQNPYIGQILEVVNSPENTGRLDVDFNGLFNVQKSYAVFVIYADASRYKNYARMTFPTVPLNAEFLSKLPPRSVELRVEVDKGCKGTFKFDASNDSELQKIAATAKTLRTRITSSKGLPKAGMKNSNIERQLVSLFNGMGWDEKFKKAIITSTDYGYKRVAGRITGRTLSVIMLSKKSDGTCMYQDFTVIQPKTGGGYGSFRRLSTGSQSDIGCDKF